MKWSSGQVAKCKKILDFEFRNYQAEDETDRLRTRVI